MKTQTLTGYTVEELRLFAASHGEKPYRGDQLFGWIHQKQAASFAEMTDISASFRSSLSETATLRTLTTLREATSSDGTRKFALRLDDGAIIESVLIPAGVDRKRLTLCVSTQVGCPLDCAFCATGTMGFTRNLKSGEIVEQYLAAQEASTDRISNIVYMGMGEPMLNYANVMRSIDLLADERGAGIGVRHGLVQSGHAFPQQLIEQLEPPSAALGQHVFTCQDHGKRAEVCSPGDVLRCFDRCRLPRRERGIKFLPL